MFHVPILLLRLGNMLLLLLLLSCVPHWTCVTRRFSFFAYQLTLISLFVDEGKWERNGKFMRTHCCCCCCCCCFKWCGWGWPFYLNGILMRKDCTIVCLFFTYTGAVLCCWLAGWKTHMALQTDFQRTFPSQTGVLSVCRRVEWGGWGGRKKEQDEDWHKSACGARPLLICNVRVGIIFIAGTAEEDATQTIFRCEGLGTYMYLLSYYSLSLLLVLIRNPILGPSVNAEVPQLETAGGRMRWAYIR